MIQISGVSEATKMAYLKSAITCGAALDLISCEVDYSAAMLLLDHYLFLPGEELQVVIKDLDKITTPKSLSEELGNLNVVLSAKRRLLVLGVNMNDIFDEFRLKNLLGLTFLPSMYRSIIQELSAQGRNLDKMELEVLSGIYWRKVDDTFESFRQSAKFKGNLLMKAEAGKSEGSNRGKRRGRSYWTDVESTEASCNAISSENKEGGRFCPLPHPDVSEEEMEEVATTHWPSMCTTLKDLDPALDLVPLIKKQGGCPRCLKRYSENHFTDGRCTGKYEILSNGRRKVFFTDCKSCKTSFHEKSISLHKRICWCRGKQGKKINKVSFEKKTFPVNKVGEVDESSDSDSEGDMEELAAMMEMCGSFEQDVDELDEASVFSVRKVEGEEESKSKVVSLFKKMKRKKKKNYV